MRPFEILFDNSEAGELDDPAYGSYGKLGFPKPPAERPWIFTNFVQSLDGIASLTGKYASGFHIGQSEEDRWVMDLLRAHADALLVGVKTLTEEVEMRGYGPRGPVYRIVNPELAELRSRLGRKRELCIFVSGTGNLKLENFKIFDGDLIDTAIVTTRQGAEQLSEQTSHPHVKVIAAGDGRWVDLPLAMKLVHSKLGVRYLLSEGGPTLNGHLTRARLVDERFLTVSPIEVGQTAPMESDDLRFAMDVPLRLRPTSFTGPGFTKDEALWWTWLSCRKVGDHQFNRYRKKKQ
jgi:riboflavin biosynthesis pyrimidine reductase